MSATAVIFPFDAFGNAGTGEGALLLADVLREAIADAELEERETRIHSFSRQLWIEEHPFETMEQLQTWRTTGRDAAKRLLASGHFGLWLAGNHLGVLPVYEELGPKTTVIQFDAHLDCYDLHDTTEELSHGNWMLHAEAELPSVVNVGHRDQFLIPADVERCFVQTIPAERLGDADTVLRKLAKKADRIWIDIDLDVIDPAFAPAVHDALPFGLSPRELLAILNAVWSEKVCGVSFSEFDPGRDDRDRTLQLLGWLLEWLLLKRFEGKSAR